MMKKGFTLIELLAVIVILAIIALIATPTILGVIEKAKKGSAESSTYGYIDALDKYLLSNSMSANSSNIKSGTYKASELNIEYKGNRPDNAIITIENGSIKEVKICINDYSFDYDGTEVTSSVNNYCSENYKVTLVIDDQEEEKSIGKETSTTFEISDLTGKTNIVCNNGATPTIENNTLTISNIYGNTTCYINNTLEDTINNLDNTLNSIIMISDEEINANLTIDENKNINLNLNEKHITGMTTGYLFTLYGNMNVDGQKAIIDGTKENSFVTFGESKLSINGGTYNYANFNENSTSYVSNAQFQCTTDQTNCYTFRTYKNAYVEMDNIYTYTAGKAFGVHDNSSLIISNSNLNCHSDNCIYLPTSETTDIINTTINAYGYILRTTGLGVVNIKNCIMNTSNTYGIRVDKVKTLNIYDSDIYALSSVVKFNESTSEGIINIFTSKLVSENAYATINYSDTGVINIYSGVYISNNYKAIGNNAGGTTNIIQTNDSLYIGALSTDISQYAINGISIGSGLVNISGNQANKCTNNYEDTTSGLCIYSTEYSSYSTNDSKININGGTFVANVSSIVNNGSGTINICSAQTIAKSYDIRNDSTGTINYSSDVIFTTGTNTPKYNNSSGTINANYTGTCLSN